MKKTQIILLGLLAVFPIISSASIDISLKYGAKGAEVTELQEFLIDKGFLHTTATGNFYSLTKSAVIAYQGSENLPTTGFVGPMTRGKINETLASDDSAEIQETGTVTPPVDTTNGTKLQTKIDDLTQQVKDLTEQTKLQNTKNNVIIPVMETPVDKSEIVVKQQFESGSGQPGENDPASGKYPFGAYFFTITVLDSNGKPNPSTVDANGNLDKVVPIVTTFPEDNFGPQKVRNDIANPSGQNTARYVPTTPGTKTITFISGTLTKTVTVGVK